MRVFVAGASGGGRPQARAAASCAPATVSPRSREAPARRRPCTPRERGRWSSTSFDREAVGKAVAGQDVVVNLATHIPSSSTRMLLPGAWRENDRIRRVASANLADAAIAGGVGRLIQDLSRPSTPAAARSG